MDEEIITTEQSTTEPTAEVVDVAEAIAPVEDAAKSASKRVFGNRNQQRRGGQRRTPRREERVKPEFDQKIISMRRVTRVVAGGRRMSFAVALVAGNRKGKVGVGTGKAVDTALAIEKAFRDAKKHMISVPLTKNSSIPHDVRAKYSASVATLVPAKGRGLVAGGAVRSVLELAGITDVTSKILSRSKNGINNARAAVKALEQFHPRKRA